MPNNLILRTVEVTADYAPLSARPLVGTVDVSTPPTNSGPVFFKAGATEEAWFLPGEFHGFVRVPLHEVFVKGTPGDTVTIIGGTH